MLRSLAPVPWVPVEIAPAIVWRSMSPRFSIASPSPCSSSLSSARTVPAADLDQAATPGSASITPLERADVDHRPVGHRRLGEGVAGAGDADLAARRRGGGDRLRQLVAVARARPRSRRAAGLVAGPVAPLRQLERREPRAPVRLTARSGSAGGAGSTPAARRATVTSQERGDREARRRVAGDARRRRRRRAPPTTWPAAQAMLESPAAKPWCRPARLGRPRRAASAPARSRARRRAR